MPYSNNFLLASAGAGKTTKICKFGVKHNDKRILFTTYTNENTSHLHNTLCSFCGVQPSNVTIMSWFSFLLTECIRPYQHYLYPDHRIDTICFVQRRSAPYASRDNIKRYYLSDETHIYSDKLTDFICRCNDASNGLIIKRLEEIFDVIIIDEVQDIAGHDFDFMDILLQSKIKIIMVGDIRQKTYSTNHAPKNKKFSNNILEWFKFKEQQGYGIIKHLNQSYRCIQEICNFADILFPHLPPTKSLNEERTGHDGLFYITPLDLFAYYETFNPQILVYDKRSDSKALGLPTKNYGAVKGATFERVLIVPTKKIEQYLSDGNIEPIKSVIEKFYVAITRAKFSVAFLVTSPPSLTVLKKWTPHDI